MRGWIYAALAIAVWGVTFASTRALLADFSALEILVMRFSLAFAALWGVELLRGGAKRGSWRNEWIFAAMGLTGIVAYQFLENCAIYYTNASNVAILVSFGPIVTAVMARMLTADRSLSPRLVCGSLVAVAGVAVVALNGVVSFQLRPLGDAMALAAMASWGIYSVLIEKANRLGVEPLAAVRKSFGWAVLMMLPLAAWGVTEAGYIALDGSCSVTLGAAANIERLSSFRNLGNLAFLGLLASAACFVLWSRACRALGVVRTTIGLYLTPVVGVVFATLFLGERITWLSAVGGILIVCGVAVANMKRRDVR
jgi:drug/metabolite transporter (DMT)-like permease